MTRKSRTSTPSALQREIRQTRPFASRAQEATIALLRTADVIRRRVSQTLEPHDLSLSQYNVLRILRGAGEAGLPTLEIAARMIEETPGITRLLDRLEAKGLVRRLRCEHDRRQVLCWATPAALDLLARLDGPVLAADEGGLVRLGKNELAHLVRLLDAVRASSAAPEPRPEGVPPAPPASPRRRKSQETRTLSEPRPITRTRLTPRRKP